MRGRVTVMRVFVWMVTWLRLGLPAVSELPMPVDLTVNFSHLGFILRWAPGAGTPAGASYRVSLETDRKQLDVYGCEQVQQPLMCNLMDALDLTETYTVMVTALMDTQHSEAATITGFTPISALELPLLVVSQCDRNLCVDFQPAHKHFWNSYNNLDYQLQITSEGGQFKDIKDIRSLTRVVLPDLFPGRQYCISVRFSDILLDKHSNFSRPVCAYTSSIFPIDPFIATLLCFLVMTALGFLAMIFYTGFICLKTKPVPSVLTSIHHFEASHFPTSCAMTQSSLVKVLSVTPPKRRKNSSQSSMEESDEESSTEITGGSTGKHYEHTTSLFTSSSSSLVPVSAIPKTVAGLSSDQPANRFQLPEKFPSQTLPDAQSSAVPTNSLTSGRSEAIKEEQMLEESSDHNVNLLTLTFGGQEAPQQAHPDLPEVGVSEQDTVTPVLPSQTVAAGWCAEKEEDEPDEDDGYMGRPPTYGL